MPCIAYTWLFIYVVTTTDLKRECSYSVVVISETVCNWLALCSLRLVAWLGLAYKDSRLNLKQACFFFFSSLIQLYTTLNKVCSVIHTLEQSITESIIFTLTMEWIKWLCNVKVKVTKPQRSITSVVQSFLVCFQRSDNVGNISWTSTLATVSEHIGQKKTTTVKHCTIDLRPVFCWSKVQWSTNQQAPDHTSF